MSTLPTPASVRRRRKALGVTQAALSRSSGVPVPYVCEWLSGIRKLTDSHRMALGLGLAALERTEAERLARVMAYAEARP
jgi:predicted transcriptional regulator